MTFIYSLLFFVALGALYAALTKGAERAGPLVIGIVLIAVGLFSLLSPYTVPLIGFNPIAGIVVVAFGILAVIRGLLIRSAKKREAL